MTAQIVVIVAEADNGCTSGIESHLEIIRQITIRRHASDD